VDKKVNVMWISCFIFWDNLVVKKWGCMNLYDLYWYHPITQGLFLSSTSISVCHDSFIHVPNNTGSIPIIHIYFSDDFPVLSGDTNIDRVSDVWMIDIWMSVT